MKKHKRFRRTFVCEQLEPRCLLSGFQAVDASDFHAIIVAGDPNLRPSDSPAIRVDANTASSPFAGVGSLQISRSNGTYICTGTPIDATRVLTAGHCIDFNNDGKSDSKDGIVSITFNLNYGGNLTSQISAKSWQTHPDFTGFARPSVNDDLAVITLGSGVPTGVPTYSLATSDMVKGTTHLYMVGYGRSGDGVNGYTTGASFTEKRDGENIVDAFYTQDDRRRAAANEVFRFDFDGPTGNGSLGGSTLGNDKETTLGGGDSGGPSLVLSAGSYMLAGVNTFTQGSNTPKFGSLGGGINVFPYTNWILLGTAPTGSGGSGASGGGSVLGNAGSDESSAIIVPPSDVTLVSTVPLTSSVTSSVTFSILPIWPSHHVTLVSTAALTPRTSANESGELVGSVLRPPFTTDRETKDRETKISHDDRLKAVDEIFDLKTLDGIFEEWALTVEA